MKKWIGPLLSLLLIILMILFLGSFKNVHQVAHENKRAENQWIRPTQDTEKEGKKREVDSYYIPILKETKELVDGWLKSLNDRIEKKEVTHLEVRFLEILRNILEWVKEKIDKELEPSKRKEQEKKKRGGFMQETHVRIFPSVT